MFSDLKFALRSLANLAPGVQFVASERNDKSVCKPCADMDGHQFTTLEAALAVYPNGQNVACLGRDRCRGTLFAITPDHVSS